MTFYQIKNTKYKMILYFLLIVSVQLGYIVHQVFEKTGYHIDENYSFGLSNSAERAFLNQNNSAQDKWLNEDYFKNYLTVQVDQKFNYKSVYRNQVNDVHPPLYYFMLHTVSSFFPNKLSKWPAEGMNLLFFLFAQLFLFLLSLKIFKNKSSYAYIVILLYGFSGIAVDTVIYIRMYALLTMLAVISIFMHFKAYENDNKPVYLLLILISTYLGCLTQYYFLIFSFSLALISSIFLLLHKRFKAFIFYISGMILTVIAMILSFPAVIEHLFGGGKIGTQTLDNARDLSGAIGRFLRFSMQIYQGFFFSKHLLIGGLVLISLLVLFALLTKKGPSKTSSLTVILKNNKNLVNLLSIVVLTIVIISLVAFDAYIRYVYFLMPLFSLCLVYLLFIFFSFPLLDKNQNKVLLIIAFILLGAFNMFYLDSNYLYKDYSGRTEIINDYQDYYGVLFCKDGMNPALTQECREFMTIKGLYCTNESNSYNINAILKGKDINNGFLLWVDVDQYWSSGYDAHSIIQNLLESSGFTKSACLYKYGLVEVYHIS